MNIELTQKGGQHYADSRMIAETMVTLQFKRGWACRRYSFAKGEHWEVSRERFEAAKAQGFLALAGGQVPMSHLRVVKA